MTRRAIGLGLIGVGLICGFSYFNDAVMRQTFLVGNNMPIAVYGGLILFVLLVNSLLARLGRRWDFSGSELALAMGITLAACCIPGSGLMRYFTTSLILPHHYARLDPGWQEQKVLELVPARMLADISREEATTLNGFIQGLGVGQKRIGLSQIPWFAWTRTLAFWVPLLLSVWVALTGLSLVVHRQWARHEQLPYPIAQFASALLPQTAGAAMGRVLHSRPFWIGAAFVLAIHLNNYACQWFPAVMVKVPLSFNFLPLSKLVPVFERLWPDQLGWVAVLYNPKFFFTVIAFAYFLATDVSVSLFLGPWIYSYIAAVLLQYGISTGGSGYMAPNVISFLNFGAYFGLFLVIAYTGRHYYSLVLRRAFFLPSAEEPEPAAVWGARAFVVALVLMVANLVLVGLDWPLALLFSLGTVMIFLGMSRIMAETGLFLIQPFVFPCAILLGFLGPLAADPRSMMIMLLVSVILMVDPRESLMPFVVNSLKLNEMFGNRVGRVAILCVLAVIVGLAVALPVQLYFQYNRGANMADGWATYWMAREPFKEVMLQRQRLAAQDALELAGTATGLARFKMASPDAKYGLYFAVGLGLFLLFTAGRLRFPKWPLHPVIFLLWSTYFAHVFAASFFAGWLIKTLVTKYGGAAGYQKLKPFMFGLIAGDMLGGIIPILVGFVYYFVTGQIPKPFAVMPG